jgi:hypothetical protein
MSSIRIGNLRLVVYPNDHTPAHVHVLGQDWEIRVALTRPPVLMSILGKPKKQAIASALLAVSDRLDVLKTMWSNLHD